MPDYHKKKKINNTFTLYLQTKRPCGTAVAAGSYHHLNEIYPELAEGSAGWTPGTGILPIMKSMTSDFWYVGKVLAKEPEDGGRESREALEWVELLKIEKAEKAEMQ